VAEDVERTEQPTPRRRQEARREGQIAVSAEIGTTANLLVVLWALSWAGAGAAAQLPALFRRLWAVRTDLDVPQAAALIGSAAGGALPLLLPVLAAALAGGILAGIAQTRGALTTPRARPRLSRLSPLRNISRVLRRDAPLEILKALLKLGIASAAIAWAIGDRWPQLLALGRVPLGVGGALQLRVLLDALLAGTLALALVAALDYAWQRAQLEKRLRMTRAEVRDELRQNQGDAQVRTRQLSLMLQRSLRRMLADVPRADVVVTNPEHISIALSYRRGEMGAPTVLARGAGFVALRIREIARASGVPIVENRPLARTLYRSVRVGQQIPQRLFEAVAEVLAYVYRLDRRRGARW
jgi:flagellar biosynthetic protein FlhB